MYLNICGIQLDPMKPHICMEKKRDKLRVNNAQFHRRCGRKYYLYVVFIAWV